MTYNFNNAIIRKPNKSIQNGLSSQNLHPQYEIVLEEHYNYIKSIREAGIKIKEMITSISLADMQSRKAIVEVDLESEKVGLNKTSPIY